MTVKEVIEFLQKLPDQNAPVVLELKSRRVTYEELLDGISLLSGGKVRFEGMFSE